MSRMRLRPRSSPRWPTRTPGRSALPRNAMESVVWQGKPSRKTRGARRRRWTICFDAVPDHTAVPAFVFSAPLRCSTAGKRAYRLFQSNPAHPGLQFKKLEGEDNIYSVRIGLEFRAMAVMKKDRIVWYWIGSHSVYDRLA